MDPDKSNEEQSISAIQIPQDTVATLSTDKDQVIHVDISSSSSKHQVQQGISLQSPLERTRELREISKRLYAEAAERAKFHTSFTVFEKLPNELKTMIFKLAVPLPQVVHIKIRASKVPRNRLNSIPWTLCPDRASAQVEVRDLAPGVVDIHKVNYIKPSGLFGACQFSRQVILQTHNTTIECSGRTIRFDGAKDVIMIRPELQIGYREPNPYETLDLTKIFSGIRNLAIEARGIHSTDHTPKPWLIAQFPDVKVVTSFWSSSPQLPQLEEDLSTKHLRISEVALSVEEELMSTASTTPVLTSNNGTSTIVELRDSLTTYFQASGIDKAAPDLQFREYKFNPFRKEYFFA